MMLIKDFYTLNTLEQLSDTSYLATIALNKDHEIFKAHFPGNPVTPGVCMMQVIKELLEIITGRKIVLIKSGDIKFTALINPFKNEKLDIDLNVSETTDILRVKILVSFNTTLALKMTGNYKFL